MARLAIVINAVGSVESFEGTLVSVLENRPADCEVLVALNQPYSDPYDLKDEVRFIQSTASSPSLRVNEALAGTRAPFVHLLGSGCQVTDGWTESALARFGDRQVGSVAPLVFDVEQPGQIVAAGVGYRASGKRVLVGRGKRQLLDADRASVVGPSGIAAFYRKAALDLVGGFSSRLGVLQADVDLALCLAQAGFAVAIEPQSHVLAPAGVDDAQSAFQKALCEERLFWRNLPAGGGSRVLAAHAVQVGLELTGSLLRPRMLAQIAGHAWGCCEIAGHMRHRRALAQLHKRAIRPRTAQENYRIDRSHDVAPSFDAVSSRARTH